MKIARHEDAVAMLTGGLSYVTLVVVREKVINKRMLPLSKLQDQSLLNKRLGTKVCGKSKKIQCFFCVRLMEISWPESSRHSVKSKIEKILRLSVRLKSDSISVSQYSVQFT